ncbi:MAG: hypothetical protein PVG27_13780, partial [Chloroflexota bacterium]
MTDRRVSGPDAEPQHDHTAAEERLRRQLDAVQQLPDQNPNPVLRVGEDGTLLYANGASAPVVEALGLVEGEHMPADLWTRLCAAARSGSDEPVEVRGDARWFELTT